MTFALFAELPDQRRQRISADRRDWLEVYRRAEATAEYAAEAVRAASEAYRRDRSPANDSAYRLADRAYDVARLNFQREGSAIVTGIRAIACIARELELADAMRERML